MLRERILHLGSAHAVTRHIEHIVDAARNPDVTVLVPPRTISTEVVSLSVHSADTVRGIQLASQVLRCDRHHSFAFTQLQKSKNMVMHGLCIKYAGSIHNGSNPKMILPLLIYAYHL